MSRKTKLIDKQVFKKSEGKCRVCGETDYSTLDVHRIKEGKNGGEYTRYNSVCLCCKCHRKVHDGQILIGRYYLSSNGNNVLSIIENGEEKFI